MGSSPHHIKNTGDFIEQIKHVKLQADETITSYDVSAQFTSVPIEAAINIIQRRLELDQELPFKNHHESRAYHQPTGVLLKDNLFPIPGQLLWADQGASIGSPISPIVASLFMEEFEVKAIQTAKMWKRYVDDTCVILSSTSKDDFFHHINSIDPRIQFTSEDSKPDGSIPFLDSLVMPQPDGSIKTIVFRKPTHTDMYLHCNSYHHLSAKYGVINTLRHRAKTVCST